MNKYFKYILLTISLFLIGSMKVEAKVISCTYEWRDNTGVRKITMKTKDGGNTWYEFIGAEFLAFNKPERLIDGLNYPVSSTADCPPNDSLNLTYEVYTYSGTNYKGGDIVPYHKITLEGATPTLSNENDKKIDITSKKEQALKDAQGGNSAPIKPQNPGTTSCQSLFAGLEDELKKIFNAIKIVVPILVIVFSSLDFAKAIFGGSDDDVKKSQIKFVKRLVVAFVFFLLPTLMAFAMGIMDVIYNGGNFDCLILN